MVDFFCSGPGGAATGPVSDHPRWAGPIGKKIIAADICWEHDPRGTIRAPAATRLGFRRSVVWFAPGVSVDTGSATSFWFGTDDFMIIFTPEMSS